MNKIYVCIAPDFLTLTAMCGKFDINLSKNVLYTGFVWSWKTQEGSTADLNCQSGQEITINKLLTSPTGCKMMHSWLFCYSTRNITVSFLFY